MVAISAPSYTGACCIGVSCGEFIKTIRECPDVLAGSAMRHTDSIHIVSVYRPTRTKESVCISQLVASDSPTHLVVLLTTSEVSDTLTVTTSGPSSTYPVWSGDLPPHRGTLLGGVRHVEVGYTSPAS